MKTGNIKARSLEKVSMYTYLLMILTTIHHAYGAYIYDSPFRLHVVFVSVPLVIITFFLTRAITAGKSEKKNSLLFMYYPIILAVILFGLFEGVYNHFLKVLLFYAGTPENILYSLFPPPTYEMPNNFFFEFTGVLQAVVFLPILLNFSIITKDLFSNRNRVFNLSSGRS